MTDAGPPAIDPALFPALHRLCNAVLRVWPAHDRFLRRRFDGPGQDMLVAANGVADRVLQTNPGRLDDLAAGYRWMCEAFQAEELFFHRTGRYQRTTFAEADEWIYQHSRHMPLYLDGMLVALVLWRNHTDAIDLYRRRFLATAPDGHDHLEIGPGHGLLLAYAAEAAGCRRACGWDISPASLDRTRHLLTTLGLSGRVELLQTDFLRERHDMAFDSIVLSEVLEHLEDPATAMLRLHELTRPGGRVFLNVPVNSPAPDHIFLFRTPEDVEQVVRDAGFETDETHLLPATGLSLERARRQNGTISVVSILRRPG